MTFLTEAPLGKISLAAEGYSPSLLFPIERARTRQPLSFGLQGFDLWRAYEFSWLDRLGKPQIALLQFLFPATSPFLIESKSFKLYLNSFSEEQFVSWEAVKALLENDLSLAAAAQVTVALDEEPIRPLEGISLDTLLCPCNSYQVDSTLLKIGSKNVSESLFTHLFKAHCLVTDQPDWASIEVRYEGPQIDREGLLRYLVSYRKERGLHEQCIERIYSDLKTLCHPEKLTVIGHFTRRGGLDITPCRTSHLDELALPARQIRQ